MLLKLLREGLGRVFIFGSWLTLPKPVTRSSDAQQTVDAATQKLALYQFYACPFCLKVRREIHRLGLTIEFRDAQNDATHRQTLLSEGGEIKVPCLRIEHTDHSVQWLYESSEIIAYLQQQFEPKPQQA
ncbi:MAG TPA: glutaredoxin [Thiothrix sp.]|nr:glutaredoxin [Thiothrix sp.]